MAVELETYMTFADDSLKQPWLEELLKLGMRCEFHPDFSFGTQTGFLPIKLKLLRSARPELGDKDFLTGFEFELEKFDLAALFAHKEPALKGIRGWFSKKPPEPARNFPPEVESRLADCRYLLKMRFGSADFFELRMADISSVILAQLANGICYDPQGDQWKTVDKSSPDSTLQEIEEYERSFGASEISVHPFKGWVE